MIRQCYRAPLLALLAIAGCEGAREAHRDRVQAPLEGKDPTVSMRCDSIALPERRQSDVGVGPISVTSPGDPASPAVGELFGWADVFPTPLRVAGPSPHEVLARDAARILRSAGYEVSDAPPAAGPVVRLAFAQLAVRPTPAGWLELKGRIGASAVFDAELHRNGAPAWKQRFGGNDEMRVAYFLASDSEATLNRAYCRALEGFARAVEAPEFGEAVSGR